MTAEPLASASRVSWVNLPRRTRFLLMGILFGILVWLGLVSFLLPRRAARMRLEAEVQGLAAANEVLRQQTDTLRNEAQGEEAMQRTLTEIRRRLEETLARLPEKPALSAFLRDLTAPEEGEGIVFLSITPRTLEKRGELLELPFNLELEGTYQALTRYVARLESLARLVTVRNVVLSDAARKSQRLRASLAAATYVLGKDQ